MRATPKWCAALAVSLLVLAAGCSSPFREAADRDTAEAWRSFIAAGHGSQEERAHARNRHDDLLWEEAKSLDTIAGYRRYLESVPQARNATTARRRLEALRFERAMERDEAFALEEFLARHPHGSKAEAARERLVELRLEEALEADERRAYEDFLRDFPDAPEAARVKEALERVLLDSTVEGGTLEGFERHRRRFPEGSLRAEGETHSRALKVRARVLAGDEAGAARIVAASGRPEIRRELERALHAARVEAARLRLDLEALERLAEEPGSDEAAERARESARALSSHPRPQSLSSAAGRLLTPTVGLAATVVEAGLADRDARRRRVSARALGYASHPSAIAPLVSALDDRNIGVRAEAAASLRKLGASLQAPVRDVFFTEALDRLEGVSAEPERLWVKAVLLEAAGRRDEALDAFRRAARGRDQALAMLRLARLESDDHRRAVALTSAALWLRDAVRLRTEALDAAFRPGEKGAETLHDRSLLRQMNPLLEKLRAAAELAEARPDHELRFTWLREVRGLLSAAGIMLADAEARAALEDSSWVDYDIDEGAAARAEAAEKRAEAARALAREAPSIEDVARLLSLVERSPHEAEASAAADARESEEGGLP